MTRRVFLAPADTVGDSVPVTLTVKFESVANDQISEVYCLDGKGQFVGKEGEPSEFSMTMRSKTMGGVDSESFRVFPGQTVREVADRIAQGYGATVEDIAYADGRPYQNPAIPLPGQRMSLEEFARQVIVLDIHQDEISGDVVWGPYVSDASRQAAHLAAMAEFDADTRSMFRQNRLHGFHSEDEAVLAYRENFLNKLAQNMPDVLFLDGAAAGCRPKILCGLLERPDDLISQCYKSYCENAPLVVTRETEKPTSMPIAPCREPSAPDGP